MFATREGHVRRFSVPDAATKPQSFKAWISKSQNDSIKTASGVLPVFVVAARSGPEPNSRSPRQM
jgi:hypothetical protein